MSSNRTIVSNLLICLCSSLEGQSTSRIVGKEQGILVIGGGRLLGGSTAEFTVELFLPSSGSSKIIDKMKIPDYPIYSDYPINGDDGCPPPLSCPAGKQCFPTYSINRLGQVIKQKLYCSKAYPAFTIDGYARWGSTVNVLNNKPVICGGFNSPALANCIEFSEGNWSVFANFAGPRYGPSGGAESGHFRVFHNSWVSSAGLVLVGGAHDKLFFYGKKLSYSVFAAEPDIVKQDGAETLPWFSDQDDLPDPSDQLNFRGACSTTAGDSLVITGGFYGRHTWGWDSSDVMKWGSRYNLQGLMETLPDMNLARGFHGCGSYTHINGSMVIIVAGGMYSLGTSERLVLGPEKCKTWMKMASLPRKLWYIASVNMYNTVFLIGGKDVEGEDRAEVLELVNGEDWKEIGKLNVPRVMHAATNIDLATIFNLLL